VSIEVKYIFYFVDIYTDWLINLFYRDYENAMNNVVQYVSYGCGGKNSGSGFDSNSNAGDDNNTNDEDDDNEYNDDDEERDLFWVRDFDYHKLILCATKALAMNYNNYIYKKMIMVSYSTRMLWLNKILNEN
jgi:hypothetical protein